MKLIHLSDLHLGKRVNEYSMLEDQEYILKKIINVIDDEKPDGVIITVPNSSSKGIGAISPLYTGDIWMPLASIIREPKAILSGES